MNINDMPLEYDKENGVWLLSGWQFEQSSTGIKHWNATKANNFVWAFTLNQVIEFANNIDENQPVPKLNLQPLYN